MHPAIISGLRITLLGLLPLALPARGMDVSCAAESGKTRVALLELYTSEGCDSCPPTDQWFSTLPHRLPVPQHMLALSFHVDYWNYLGWRDPYAKARFSARQRDAASRNRSRVVYTPQLLLDGADWRRSQFQNDLGTRVNNINRREPGAHIRLALEPAKGGHRFRLQATVAAGSANGAQAYVAVYENNLASDVTAGENRGRRLRHDFVVRELYGPFEMDAAGSVKISRLLEPAPPWKTADLHLAAFVQDESTGAVLQALGLPWCAHGHAAHP